MSAVESVLAPEASMLGSWTSQSGDDVCICGVGARTPLGSGADASAVAVRAGLSALGVHPEFVDRFTQAVGFARDPWLATDLPVGDRLVELARSACLEALLDSQVDFPLSLWCGVAEPRPGLVDFEEEVAQRLRSVLPARIEHTTLVPRGHAAGLMALQRAAMQVVSGEAAACLIVGVDSYHDPRTLKWLDGSGRLMSTHNRNGFPPGEGAGACVLALRSTAIRRGLRIHGHLVAAATTMEPVPMASSEVCVGKGLTLALERVIEALPDPFEAITATYCDLNGERYRNEEFVYAMLRTQEAFVDAHDYLCPADSWGDVGAASGLLFMALAVSSRRRGYSSGSCPVLWASSDAGHRSALIISTEGRQPRGGS